MTALTVFGKKCAYNVLLFDFTKALATLQETVSLVIQESSGCVALSTISWFTLVLQRNTGSHCCCCLEVC